MGKATGPRLEARASGRILLPMLAAGSQAGHNDESRSSPLQPAVALQALSSSLSAPPVPPAAAQVAAPEPAARWRGSLAPAAASCERRSGCHYFRSSVEGIDADNTCPVHRRWILTRTA